MNKNLTEEQLDDYMHFMYCALLAIRNCGPEVARDLGDMLHNLPIFLRGGEGEIESWSVEGYFAIFVAPMMERYPELSSVWRHVPRD